MTLSKYKKKRHFNKTPEPPGGFDSKDKREYPIFVVHKHAARRLHYDLRLEMQGVLKSFAVPKGPSLDPAVKRLAVMVEDHPLDYKDFEGVIPEGNYGAGKVLLWDRGFYSPLSSLDKKKSEALLLQGLKKGDLKFILAGEKLKGEFALIKTRWDKNSWLLIKKKDRYASTADILKRDRSVLSHQPIEEPAGKTPAQPGARPHKVRPMLATAAGKPFDNDDWIFEVKWDGYRAIAEISPNNVLLYSRNQRSLADKFPGIVESLKKLKFNAVLDGEVVAVDKTGKPVFQLLQDYRRRVPGRLIYYVFDILFYQNRDLTGLELRKRKELLKQVLPDDARVRYAEHVKKDGVSFFKAVKKQGLEGIVAKHAKSRYQAGVRSKLWLKIKYQPTQDCVIVGFTRPRGSRGYFGSLVLGAFENKKLIYVGHSGGGFGGQNIKMIYDRLRPLVRKNCPLSALPPESETVTWVKPELVCEVAFTEWTKDGVMRQPKFVRFREDKSPAEAIRERAGRRQSP
ncbi:MAG: non-homologous end-joining DNA ligase [Candidatus Margulisiibacteriota bacterium]|jgi:bifunctional non-homologous end joining protein LigD